MGTNGRQIGQSSKLAASCAGLSPGESEWCGLFKLLYGGGLLQATHVDLMMKFFPDSSQGG